MIIIVLGERKGTDLVAIVHQLVFLKKRRRFGCAVWYYILLRRCCEWYCKQNFDMHWVLLTCVSMPLPYKHLLTPVCSYAISPVQQVALAEWCLLIGFPIPLDSRHFLNTAWNEKRDVSVKLNYVEKNEAPSDSLGVAGKFILSNQISFSDLGFI